ncbi:hypothetical protein PInf_013268 [Phytophthora infestans]|nr:hypothetical protein PInf_013268 [Phytophthora infestans]
MAEYPKTMNQLRLQMINFGALHAADDDEMVRLLAMGVSLTHPELSKKVESNEEKPTAEKTDKAVKYKKKKANYKASLA